MLAKQLEEEKEKENKNKITYEVLKENPNKIEFELHIVYQGPPFEDPNPPPVEEKPVPAKGGKVPPKGQPAEEVKHEPRMITPDPVIMINESGRTFEFELGRYEKVYRSSEDTS